MKFENEKPENIWLAVKSRPDWRDCMQCRHFAVWSKIVAIAQRTANSTGFQVRLSTSAGYENNGHYFDPET
jgi:hypothetical protein